MSVQSTTPMLDSRLGSLLLHSKVISPQQLDDGLAKNVATGVPIGSILLVQSVISHQLLDSALTAQTQLRNGAVTHNEAISNIAKVAAGIATTTARSGDLVRYSDFLRICKIINPTQIASLEAQGILQNDEQLANAMLTHGYATEFVVELSQKCFALVMQQELSIDKAVFTFEFCRRDMDQRRVALSDSAEKLAFQFGIWALYDAVTA